MPGVTTLECSSTMSDELWISMEAWQDSLFEERRLSGERPVVVISPSQFRSLLNMPSKAVEFARATLQFVIDRYPRQMIVVLIADEIQKFSIAVCEHKSEKRAKEVAAAQGNKIREIMIDACRQLPTDVSTWVKIIQWNDITTSTSYESRVTSVRTFVENVEHAAQLVDKVSFPSRG